MINSSFKFYILSEIVVPTRPLNNIDRRRITKSGGTWRQRKVLEFSFRTSVGNVVKVHFDEKEDKEYDIMFYVNETQYDKAAGEDRDSEILNGVLWIIRNKSESLGAKSLTFEAQIGEGDVKTVRGLNIDRFKPIALSFLKRFRDQLSQHQVQMIEPNASLYIKLNRPVPPARVDLDKAKWLNFVDELEKRIHSNSSLVEFLSNFNGSLYTNHIEKIFDIKDLVNSLNNLSNAIESNLESGWRRHKNRRESLWTKLVERYLSDVWDMKKSGTKFFLTRKSL